CRRPRSSRRGTCGPAAGWAPGDRGRGASADFRPRFRFRRADLIQSSTMRGILVVLGCVLAIACKGKSDASTSPDPEAVKEQQALIARREALLAQRQELQTKSDALDTQIKEIQAKG